MSGSDKDRTGKIMIKIVYFDEESASDYLDISAGGKEGFTTEAIKERLKDVHAKTEAGLIAKFSWLPFFGGSAEVSAGAGLSASGKSILSKTLSNTILTDYLVEADNDQGVVKHRGLRVSAPEDSMAYAKMFTPYMIIAKTEDQGIDLARLDEALTAAKGYYELLGESEVGSKCVLRFNIGAFRNNYGLVDLRRMQLVFHGIHVGKTSEHDLSMKAEMAGGTDDRPPTAAEFVDGATSSREENLLDVYDVILAGVERAE